MAKKPKLQSMDEFANFDDLARKLLTVPKKDIDAARRTTDKPEDQAFVRLRAAHKSGLITPPKG